MVEERSIRFYANIDCFIQEVFISFKEKSLETCSEIHKTTSKDGFCESEGKDFGTPPFQLKANSLCAWSLQLGLHVSGQTTCFGGTVSLFV